MGPGCAQLSLTPPTCPLASFFTLPSHLYPLSQPLTLIPSPLSPLVPFMVQVDVERYELEVLRGVGKDLWPRVSQVSIEVHDRTLPISPGSSSLSPSSLSLSSLPTLLQPLLPLPSPSDSVSSGVAAAAAAAAEAGSTVCTALSSVKELLETDGGFLGSQIWVDQDPLLTGSNIYMVYASRLKDAEELI
jgi:hypothetical protein